MFQVFGHFGHIGYSLDVQMDTIHWAMMLVESPQLHRNLAAAETLRTDDFLNLHQIYGRCEKRIRSPAKIRIEGK